MPIKTFANGNVLTDTDLNTYLMNQAVLVFDDSTARSSAIGTATEGMVSYLKDTDSIQYFDSASWVALPKPPTFTSSTATAYTVQTADENSVIEFTDSVAVTISTATAFTPGQQVQVIANGAALTILSDGPTMNAAGTAITTAGTFQVGGQYEAFSIFCVGTDEYNIIGNISEVAV